MEVDVVETDFQIWTILSFLPSAPLSLRRQRGFFQSQYL